MVRALKNHKMMKTLSKRLNKRWLRYLALILAYGIGGVVACSKMEYSAAPCGANCVVINNQKTYAYNYTTGQPAADILFVVDNSASMYPIQQGIGNAFNSFLSQIQNYDLHIAITNTDISSSPSNSVRSTLDGVPYVQDGNLYAFPDGSSFLTNASSNLTSQFKQTIQRQETLLCQNWIAANCSMGIGCTNTSALWQVCPSEFTRGIVAANLSVGSNPGGFIRGASVPLNVVVISNADEFASAGQLSIDTMQANDYPANLMASVQTAFPGKQFKAQSIIIQPGDTACYNQQHVSATEFGWYGTQYYSLSVQTGGYVGSICASDYSGIMQNIATNLMSDNGNRSLPCQPANNVVNVVFAPTSVNSSYSVASDGNGGYSLNFTPALPAGTNVTIELTCAN